MRLIGLAGAIALLLPALLTGAQAADTKLLAAVEACGPASRAVLAIGECK